MDASEDRAKRAFRAFCAEHDSLLRQPRLWMVGFSGGMDSTALLHLLWRWLAAPNAEGIRTMDAAVGRPAVDHAVADGPAAPRLEAMHLHHHARGDAADADAEAAAAWCAARGIVFRRADALVAARALAGRGGWEAAGRDARRAWWMLRAQDEIRHGRPPPLLWLGHHKDDQTETVLFRLRRGAARRGVAGLRPVQTFAPESNPAGLPSAAMARPDARAIGFVALRPLLAAGKEDLRAYARFHGLDWSEDASNADPRWTRNALRHERLPALRARAPDLDQRLLALAASSAKRESRERRRARDWLAAAWTPTPGGARLAWPPSTWPSAPTPAAAATATARPAKTPTKISPPAITATTAMASTFSLPDAASPAWRRLLLREAYERATGRLIARRALLDALENLATRGRVGARLSLPAGWRARREADGVLFYRDGDDADDNREARGGMDMDNDAVLAPDAADAVFVEGVDDDNDNGGDIDDVVLNANTASAADHAGADADAAAGAGGGGGAGKAAARPAGWVQVVRGGVLWRMRLGLFPGVEAARRMARDDPGAQWLAEDAFAWPLVVRARRPGDRFRPLGGSGTRKLKDFLIDLRVPPGEKQRARVLADVRGILWLWPHRLDERARVLRAGQPAWRIAGRIVE